MHFKGMNKISLKLSQGDKTRSYHLENSSSKLDFQVMDCYKTVLNEYSDKCFNIAQVMVYSVCE